ncbi:DUF3160 domain-containing protein [Candidatus Parcubacteria bacterium]|nr:DUF3160 domain-containing protein [Candidatus Parcubacteria bacterium]
MFDGKQKFNIKEEEKNHKKTNRNFSILPNFPKQDVSNQNEGKKPLIGFLSRFGDNANIIAAAVFVLILALGIFSYFVFINKPGAKTEPAEALPGQGADNSAGMLPDAVSGNGNGDAGAEGSGAELKAEDLTFGYFYKKDEEDLPPSSFLRLDLPMNVKTDVSNYYDVSRKVNLDSRIDQLNQEGFAVLDNPFAKECGADGCADNFYGMFDLLSEKQAPLLITSDFLIYYYQNVLKQAFKDIEKDVFYNDLWQINKSFYEIANNRYRESRKNIGIANDPILEGQRLEAAYFAVVLELLKPKANQISQEANENKFSEIEAAEFEFSPPAYFQEDINKEMNLIIEAKKESKSPIFLYSRNYQDFKIPKDYESNAKLRNFYLAAKWMNSAFPLYYISEECPDCLLDEYDWTINMIAACMITKDFFDNQDLKNKWAKIYKVLSFFNGLRRDLTYLHYQSALVDFFGDDYGIDNIFSYENPQKEENLLKLREKIAENSFFEIEGGINRENSSNKKFLGMRMLQQAYWPNDYIFSQLTTPNVGFYDQDIKDFEKGINLTSCRKEKPSDRCNGFGMDVINLIYPIGGNSEYFNENINYQDYDNQISYLRSQLEYFNVDSWHNNIFWTTLSMAKLFLESVSSARHPYVSASWLEKNINTSLAAWVNLQLPADELAGGWKKQGGNLGLIKVNSDYDYIEPDIKLAGELISDCKMLLDTLTALEVVKESDFVHGKLTKLISELENVKSMIKKELNGEILDYSELEIINNLAKQFIVAQSGEKDIELKFVDSDRIITESIAGVKLLVLVYDRDGSKFFAIGPIFNYQER